MALGSPASLDELRPRPSADPRVFLRTLFHLPLHDPSRAARGLVIPSTTFARCAWRSLTPELGCSGS